MADPDPMRVAVGNLGMATIKGDPTAIAAAKRDIALEKARRREAEAQRLRQEASDLDAIVASSGGGQ